MPAADFANLLSGVTVARPNLAQVLTRHAVESVESDRVVAGRGEQFVERSPVVSPIEVKADALAKFPFFNFSASPFIQNVLVTGENRLNAQHHRTPVHLRITNQRRQISLRTWQRVVIGDEHNV